MGSNKSLRNYFADNRPHILLALIFLSSFVLFRFAYLFQQDFHRIMDVATYLTWHNIFEFSGVLVSFAIFAVAYYTYEQTKSLGSILLGSIFLSVGMIDSFHTLSFMGMPAFFVENTCANRATTFWIIARLVAAGGLVITSFISVHRKTGINKRVFSISMIIFSFFVLILVTYYPNILPAMYIRDRGLTPAKVFLEYVVILLFFVTIIKYLVRYRHTKDFLIIWLSGALILNIFSELAFVSYDKVYDIYNYIGHVYKVIASYIIFRVIFIHNVQKPYIELFAAQNELKNYAENLDKLVDQRTSQLKQMNQKLLEDLEYARDIQRALLPSRLPDEKEVTFSARYFPAERVSGDLYDIFKLDSRNIGFYIGDVSGHGVPAAMLTVFLKQGIRPTSEGNGNGGEILKPSIVLRNLYESFNNTNFKDELYIVLVYGVYNFKTGELTYASAGLNVPPLIVKGSGDALEIQIKGFPVCKFREFYSGEYEDWSIKLDRGDKVLFYTDGLVEAEDSNGKWFSEGRLKEVISSSGKQSAAELSKTIEKSLFNFMDTSRLKDDITFFVMEVRNN